LLFHEDELIHWHILKDAKLPTVRTR